MAEMTLSDPIGVAVDAAMSADERVVVVGGAQWEARDPLCNQLRQRHGADRVFVAHTGNDGILGAAFGMAVAGLRPVVDTRFNGPASQAFAEIVDHVALIRHRSGHRFTAPMVIRISHGRRGAEENGLGAEIESALAHVPGLKVVVPSNPRDAQDLFLSAVGDPDPVVFLEPVRLDGLTGNPMTDGSSCIEIGRVRTEREGVAVTVLGWGASMPEARQAAIRLGEEGVSVELIDVQTLSPLDREGIAASVHKTGRAAVIQPERLPGGFGSEIAASIQQDCLYSLLAPVTRIAVWPGDSRLDAEAEAHSPSVDRIVDAVSRSFN